jgi:hypothetical protein
MLPTSDPLDTSDIFAEQAAKLKDLPFSTNFRPSRSSSFLGHLWPETVAPIHLLLCITLALLLLSSTAYSLSFTRPDTGTYIKNMTRNGYGELIIHNNWTMDTVAVLTDKNVKPLVAVYIRAKESLKITKIEDGNYGLYFTIGNLWDSDKNEFSNILGYYRYKPPLIFQTNETANDIEYSIFELDLYEAGASNFVPDNFDFPDLR